MALRIPRLAPHTGVMLDIKAAIRYLKSELNGVKQAINVLETVASDHYAKRERRANQKLPHAKHHEFVPPLRLDPDVCLWLQ
jgi:hypothetical protein